MAVDPCKREVAIEEGYVVDVATGEVVASAHDEFTVTDLGSADWVLEKIADEQAEILAIEARLTAITENLGWQRQAHERRIKYLIYKFGPALAHVARETLAVSSGKTVTLDHGQIKVRASKGTNKIVNMEAAVEWARENAPELIKVAESINVTDALPRFEMETPYFIESTGPTAKVVLDTGVGAAIEIERVNVAPGKEGAF